MPKTQKRRLTDFDRWQLHRLKALLEAGSQYKNGGAVLMAELQACKGYLTQIGLGDAIPAFEAFEYRRVAGSVLGPIGRLDMPEECLACFAAVGHE